MATVSNPGLLIKAFLSHSSSDKDFVEIVARQLGRRRTNFDKWTFETGKDFMQSIRKGLVASDCFVLFASRRSLASLWVKFEMQEAEELARMDVIRAAIVLIVDREIQPKDLPSWMQRSLIEKVLSPRAAARVIESQLNKLRGIEADPLFIGREELLVELSQKLIPGAEETPPHILLVGGLSGIGRRTLLRRGMSDFLSLRTGAIFVLQATDGIEMLHLQLLDELGALDTKAQVNAALERFKNGTLQEKAKTIAQLLASTCLGNAAPIIVDEGMLVDANTQYTAEAMAIFDALKAFATSTIGVLHTRRPRINDAQLRSIHAVYLRVPPLDLDSTTLLLTQALRRAGVKATFEQISELAPYLDGYPPAVNVAVSFAKEYGLDILLADKAGLIDFKIGTFAGILEKLGLSNTDWEILRVLASEPVLPLEALAAVVGIDGVDLANHLHRLIDFNLVLLAGNSFEIAAPIRSAVFSTRGSLNDREFSLIAQRLRNAFWIEDGGVPPIEIVTATIHAVSRGNSSELSAFRDILLPSVLFKSAKEYYDRGGQDAWERAANLIDELLKLDSDHKAGLVLRFKIQVRLNSWPEAKKTLNVIESLKLPEQHYLRGFFHWKRREFAQAVSAFRLAVSAGHHSPEVYHGLATCLFRLDNLSEAERSIQAGLKGRRPNKLLVDLAAQIAIARRNFVDAERYIDQLRRLHAEADYHHRLATYLNVRKRFLEALPHAEQALVGTRIRFEVEANLIDTLIELQRFPQASSLLDGLDERERRAVDKQDVRFGLRCKLELRQGHWKEAENLWKQIEDAARPVHIALRAEILSQKIEDLTITPGQRAEALTELERIQAEDSMNQIALFAPRDEDGSLDEA